MEAYLNKEQEQLFALQEKSFYADLTAEEQAFVLNQTSQEVFDQAHRVLQFILYLKHVRLFYQLRHQVDSV
jgi:hypothetical protein